LVLPDHFISALQASPGPLDLQRFLAVLAREEDLGRKESWLLHDMQILRRIAEILPGPPGGHIDEAIGTEELAAKIAEHITTFLQAGTGKEKKGEDMKSDMTDLNQEMKQKVDLWQVVK